MFRIRMDWESSPGIADPVLALTWARFDILIDERPVTQLLDGRSSSVRPAIYGSLFPVAEWIVENWWFLLHEPARRAQIPGGRALAARAPDLRPWIRRHDLLAGAEGNSLPDLLIFRDGACVVVQWVPDPEEFDGRGGIRFIGAGHARLSPESVTAGLENFVNAILARLEERDDDDTQRLREHWAAILDSRHAEANLCAWSASLGLDPYNADELSDDMIALLEGRISALKSPLRNDLLEASSPARLADHVDWVEQAIGEAYQGEGKAIHFQLKEGESARSAHEQGYARARSARQQLFGASEGERLGVDFEQRLAKTLGWSAQQDFIARPGPGREIQALVGPRSIVGPELLSPRARGFRLGRALHHWLFGDVEHSPRLLTEAHTWDQKSSRAFAAELLAPAEALRQRASGTISAEEVSQLADEFMVHPLVIEHQLVNHAIAAVEPS
jgi:hypothetical protein